MLTHLLCLPLLASESEREALGLHYELEEAKSSTSS
jgi:hypothetical protein